MNEKTWFAKDKYSNVLNVLNYGVNSQVKRCSMITVFFGDKCR